MAHEPSLPSEAAQRGREPGQDRHPRGGRPCKRACGEPEPKAQSNFTDPQSQIMKTGSEGFQQCCNAQMAVDGEHRIIVATQVGPQASDQGRLVGMLDKIDETFGAEPAVVLADAGYCNEPDLLELENRGIDAHAALEREGKSREAVDPDRLPATHRMGSCVPMTNLGPLGGMLYPLADRGHAMEGLTRVRMRYAHPPEGSQPIQPVRSAIPPRIRTSNDSDSPGCRSLARVCVELCAGSAYGVLFACNYCQICKNSHLIGNLGDSPAPGPGSAGVADVRKCRAPDLG